MSFNIGENVGPYRITEQLGQGGMATVYKAYHAALDRYVALKVLHPAFHEDESFIMRFQREARVVAKLEHRNIVPIYDYAEHEMRPYLVMKFIEGDTLKARLNQGPLTSNEINQVVDSIGAALAYAHKQGILHRDIKPSNVMIANDGIMYLADFGLARIAQAGESTMSSDSIMGTPQYISPEQAMGKKDLDEGTDIYSFGVMLYEMVVGQVPFSADTPFSVIHDHIYTPLPMPRAINPQVPESVERVLLKALAKDRPDRYDSIKSLIKAFRTAWGEAGIPMQGTSITMKPQALNATQRHAFSSAPAAATAVAKQAPAKKRPSAWVYVSVSVILLFCCIVGFLAIRNRRLDRLSNPEPTPAAQVNIPPDQPNEPAAPFAPQPAQQDPNPPPAGLNPQASPEIETAQQFVREHPNDPDAHLGLALAFWDAGQPRNAYDELMQATELAGIDNKDFTMKAAEKFYSRQAWVPAGAMYLRLIRGGQADGNKLPPEITERFRESVYKAAEQPDMPKFLFFERIMEVDEPLALIAQSRHILYNGSSQDARIYLDQANRLKPDFKEALLLEGEIDFKEGRMDEARQIFTVLKADLGAPDWVRRLAESYYAAMP
ncbi:MAG: protein kinase [Anaerolineales bacterium]|nr:protein kinase [Anaerolineales bacterium]